MAKAIISCKVLKPEIEALLKDFNYDYECIYLEEQLHNTPSVLHDQLQAAIDSLEDIETVYLTYSNCGNSILGLKATTCDIVFPNTDDCIHTLLYYNKDFLSMRRDTYFSSKGWLLGKEDLGFEYDRMKEKYGEGRALKLLKAMYKNYKHLCYIETVDEDKENTEKRLAFKAEKFGLSFVKTTGSIKLLEDLLRGIIDERFIKIEKGSSVPLDLRFITP